MASPAIKVSPSSRRTPGDAGTVHVGAERLIVTNLLATAEGRICFLLPTRHSEGAAESAGSRFVQAGLEMLERGRLLFGLSATLGKRNFARHHRRRGGGCARRVDCG